jgi:PAS domain S-box-containing protein
MAAPRRPPSHIAEDLKRLKQTSDGDRDRLSLLHEISVYQEELLVQNEALIRAQSALEETRDRFIELYDFAPNGYLSLDANGIICQCNLTAAAFLGRSRAAIEGLPLLSFVVLASRKSYLDFLRRCGAGDRPEVEIEATLQAGDRRREVQILCRPRGGGDPQREHFVSIVDITERKELERERARTATEQASLANRLLAGIDEERQRIAQNLHDDVGQQLTAIRLKFEALVNAAAAPATEIHSVQQMIERLDRRLHLIATELRPAALDLGLVTAIAQFVREWSAALNTPAAFHAHGIHDGDIPADVETHLYRIVQEALNNVSKHAAAQHASVLLERRDTEIVLLIEDDGQGFNLEERRAGASALGLVGMRERAHMIGGRLQIETAPGDGTSLFVYVPGATGPSRQ